eukprot:gb/GEZN01018648.1/.p1 GENE.gb/GEZN01018648.1/~~gb/GEZN01018648.1/.p1  ORF type:complete len:193 (+),score=27.20 gb/GEZN01018648.1/:109-687(+)
MSVALTKTLYNPVPDAACVEIKNLVKKEKLLAVIYGLSEDEKRLVVYSQIPAGHAWSEVVAAFPNNHIAWAVVGLPYRLVNGGRRHKCMFVKWSPDDLKRASFKESVRLKTIATFFGGLLQDAGDGFVQYQANSRADLSAEMLLQKASKLEREPVHENSLLALLNPSDPSSWSEEDVPYPNWQDGYIYDARI